jgi:hypothetical protein
MWLSIRLRLYADVQKCYQQSREVAGSCTAGLSRNPGNLDWASLLPILLSIHIALPRPRLVRPAPSSVKGGPLNYPNLYTWPDSQTTINKRYFSDLLTSRQPIASVYVSSSNASQLSPRYHDEARIFPLLLLSEMWDKNDPCPIK